MMSEEAKLLESIKKTQDILGKYIKKPPLTEKLLKKPPFRFLHDIINAIIKETGFFKGLFTEEESNSSNITDKDKKLAYLTKLIDALKLITGQELLARPSKIVSGQEPIKTNELLQVIGKSLDKKISSTEAIEHYKKSLDKKDKQRLKKSEEKLKKVSADERSKKSSSSEEKLKKFRESEEKRKSSKVEKNKTSDIPDEKLKKSLKKVTSVEKPKSIDPNKEKDVENNEQEDKRKKGKKREESDEKRERINNREKSSKNTEIIKKMTKTSSSAFVEPSKPVEDVKLEESQSLEPSKDSQDSIPEEKPLDENFMEKPLMNIEKPDKLEEITCDVEKTIPKSESIVPEMISEVKRTFLRPPSARPGAPKMRGKADFMINPNALTQMGDVNVIVENFDTKDDDAEGMVIVESSGNDENFNGNSDLLNKELTKEHGYLVAQILETQRELVNEGNVEIIPNKVEIEWEAGMKKDKEAVLREVDKLRGTIQSLTRTTNPLGKLMDFLQEDGEIMEKELWDWRNQFNDVREHFVVERNLMKDSVKPLEENLKEIETTINHQMQKIFQTKANIMKNNQKIQKLLSGK